MDASCQHDTFLMLVCEAIKQEAEQKLIDGGIDIEKVKERIGENRVVSSFTTGRKPDEERNETRQKEISQWNVKE
jgi:hypothetical protein